ncbi:MAG: hypothetical protein MUE36_13865 [Acidimicrobiales bacterium]|nr:hypothetical protein [Acidimicrobiales bacterium]
MRPTSPPTGPLRPSPPPAATEGGSARRSPWQVGIGITLVVVVLLAASGWALVATAGTDVVAAPPSDVAPEPGSVPAGPDAWDPRVTALADFVADTRGRPFLRPVPVRFLADDEFEAAIGAVGGEPTDEQAASLEVSDAQLRALGLIGPDVDLAAEADQLVAEGTLAYYDSEADAVTIRGDVLDPLTEVSVVHELTHAWQDQHFDLDRLDGDDDVIAATLRTVAEGDATFVEDRYVAAFADAERAEYDRLQGEVATEVTGGLAGVPEVLQAIFVSPYVVGPGLVQVLDAEGGNATVDEALVDPPTSEMETLQPERYLAADAPVPVEAPTLAPGQESIDVAPFGALSLLLTFAQRLEAVRSLEVVDGWAGDNAVTYTEGGRRCVAVAVTGVTGAETEAFAAAFDDWVAAGPAGAGSVDRRGDSAVLRSCEVDEAPAATGEGAQLALQYVALRLDVFRQVLEQPRTTPEQAACFSGRITAQVTPEELVDGSLVDPDEARRRGTEAAIDCLN